MGAGDCPKCGAEARMKVNLHLDAPLRYEGNLTKRALRSKDVKVEGAGWPGMTIYCNSCGWFMREQQLPRFAAEPCGHPGCMSHVSHPCEGCGRQWGRGRAVEMRSRDDKSSG